MYTLIFFCDCFVCLNAWVRALVCVKQVIHVPLRLMQSPRLESAPRPLIFLPAFYSSVHCLLTTTGKRAKMHFGGKKNQPKQATCPCSSMNPLHSHTFSILYWSYRICFNPCLFLFSYHLKYDKCCTNIIYYYVSIYHLKHVFGAFYWQLVTSVVFLKLNGTQQIS